MTYMRSWKSLRLTSHAWLGLNAQIGRPLSRIVVPLVYFFFNTGGLMITGGKSVCGFSLISQVPKIFLNKSSKALKMTQLRYPAINGQDFYHKSK
jgi:hypothetical protein